MIGVSLVNPTHKALLGITLFAAVTAANPVLAKPAPHVPRARISMAQARATALRLAPGQIKSAEYENEAGGWRYSFDIQQKGHIQEIGIDGQTGRVVENKSEGVHDRD
jgi:uncharacterized membrane protein YkoI